MMIYLILKMNMSLPSLGAWIEVFNFKSGISNRILSLPSLGAWIEVYVPITNPLPIIVAPFAGSVD